MRNWSLIADRLDRDGGLISVSQACKLVPAHRGRLGHVTPSALVRWIRFGKGGVYLDGVKCGACWLTTRQALLRFMAGVSELEAGSGGELLDERERRAKAATERMRLFAANL